MEPRPVTDVGPPSHTESHINILTFLIIVSDYSVLQVIHYSHLFDIRNLAVI
jgi:hypothetical protein